MTSSKRDCRISSGRSTALKEQHNGRLMALLDSNGRMTEIRNNTRRLRKDITKNVGRNRMKEESDVKVSGQNQVALPCSNGSVMRVTIGSWAKIKRHCVIGRCLLRVGNHYLD